LKTFAPLQTKSEVKKGAVIGESTKRQPAGNLRKGQLSVKHQ
jgi:hypothetical protein